MSPPPQQQQRQDVMAVTSLSSDVFTDQFASGQLESSGDLVGERAREVLQFSPPITGENGGECVSSAQVTSTLEPSSPENAEPVEQPEELPVETIMPTRAEPEISEISGTVTVSYLYEIKNVPSKCFLISLLSCSKSTLKHLLQRTLRSQSQVINLMDKQCLLKPAQRQELI